MKLTKVISLVLAAVMCLGMFAGCSGVNYAENNTEYVIGVSGPLTGVAAMYGVAVANASPEAKAAADYITVHHEDHAIAAVIDELDRGHLLA
jgi:hypothetical protein